MQTFEYKVVPAPNRSKRVKGVKGTAGRFAAVLTETMNEQAADGWEYLRSDSMPVEEKPGLLKSRVETYQTVLVFRRAMAGVAETPMAGYIEDQSDMVEDAPVAEDVVADVADTASEPEVTAPEAVSNDADLPAEPTISNSWSEDSSFPQDPPMTSTSETAQSDDSPFSQPETVSDDPITR